MNERDPELDALWRRHSRDEPSAALDDAIRAAAHRAVHAKPAAASPRARAPWPAWATLAAAASIGAIAIGVWQLQQRELDETKVVASDMPARPASPATARRDATQKPQPFPAQAGRIASTPERVAPAAGGVAPSAPPPPMPAARQSSPAPAAPAAPAATAASGERARAMAAEQAAAPSMQDRLVPPPAAPSATVDAKTAAAGVAASAANAPAMARAEQAPKARTVDDYVTSIRRALADGRDDDARRSLIAMRAQLADADAQLPAELREWAARVPRALP